MADKRGLPDSSSLRSSLLACAVREEEIRLSNNLRQVLLIRMLVASQPSYRPEWKDRVWSRICRRLNLPTR